MSSSHLVNGLSRPVGRLQQLYTHIGRLQADIAAAGDRLLALRDQLDEVFHVLLKSGKLRPVHTLLEDISAGWSEEDKAVLHKITDPYVNISHTFVVFFSHAVEAFSLTAGERGLVLSDIVYLANFAREIEVAVLAAQAQIADVSEELEAQIRVGDLEKALQHRVGFEDQQMAVTDEEWLAHVLIMWCRWVRSVSYSTPCFLESLGREEESVRHKKTADAIHGAQLARLALLHASMRSKYLVSTWRCALGTTTEVANDTQSPSLAAQQWVTYFTRTKPPVDCPALGRMLAELDWADDGIIPWTQDDVSHEALHDLAAENSRGISGSSNVPCP